MTALHIAILAALPAIALFWLYLFELWSFTSRLRRSAPDLWIELGKPTLSSAGSSFLMALLRGRLIPAQSLSDQDRRAATRLRAYLLVAVPLWVVVLVIMGFRRQLGLTL
jgi:hypothetical protein